MTLLLAASASVFFLSLRLGEGGAWLSLYLDFLAGGFLSPRGVTLQKVCLRRCVSFSERPSRHDVHAPFHLRVTALKITPSLQRPTQAEDVSAVLLLLKLVRRTRRLNFLH